MSYLRTIVLAAMLSGCSTVPKTVYVPVAICPEPPVLQMPVLAVDKLPAKPDAKAALEALANDHKTLKGMLQYTINLLNAYRGKQ